MKLMAERGGGEDERDTYSGRAISTASARF